MRALGGNFQMNKVYRVIFNVKKGCYTVVSEIAKQTGKSGGTMKSAVVAASVLAVLASLGGISSVDAANYVNISGTEGSISASASKSMFGGSKEFNFNGEGLSVTGTDYFGKTKKSTVIEDGKVRTSDAKYGSEHYTEIDGGSVRTENLKVVPTIKDSLEFKQGGLVVRSEDSRLIVSKNGIDQSVDNGSGQSNSVKVKQNGTVFRTTENGATGATETVIAGKTIMAGDISVNGEQGQSTIIGLTNTTVDAKDFATQGRAATEEQLKRSADKTKEELTNTIEASKAKSGHNITVDADNRVNLNDTVYLGSAHTATDSNIQIDGTKGTVKATAKKGMFSGSKTMEFTGDGLSVTGTDYAGSTKKNTAIQDGKVRVSNAAYASEHYTEIDGGSVRTENLKVVPTIKDSLEFKQGGLVVRSEDSRLIVSKNGIDQSVDNGSGQSNSVKVKQNGTVFRTTENGATGATETVIAGKTIMAGDISINGEQGQSTITGLTNTTVDAKDFATQGRAATEEQLSAVRKEIKDSGIVINRQITNIDNRVNTVETNINTINTNITDIKNDVTNVKSDIKTMNTNINNQFNIVNGDIKAMKQDISNVQSQVSTLTERADKTDVRIQTVEQSVSEHSKQINDVTSRVDTVEKTVKDTASDVKNVKESVAAVDKKVDTVASDVKTVKESVKSVDSKVTKVDARVASVETKVSTIDTNVTNLGKEVKANTETLTAHTAAANNRFASIESNINTLDQRVGSVESGMASVNQRVSKLDSRINKVGAGAAALAALHPVSGDGTKFGVAAGVGIYNGQKAVAIGGSYSPNDMTTISVGGAVGNGENMVNAGVSLKVGAGNAMSKAQMNSQIKSLQAENSALKAKDAVQDTQLQELRAEIAALKASMTK